MKEFWTAESGEKNCIMKHYNLWRAYGKAGNGNETEIGNGNWKRKWEQKNAPITGAMFLHSVLSHYSCIIGLALSVVCFVIAACYNLVWFTCETVWARDYWRPVLEQGPHSYYCSLVPRFTSSFNCLLCVKLILIVQARSKQFQVGPEVGVPIINYTQVRKWVWQLLTIMIVIVKH